MLKFIIGLMLCIVAQMTDAMVLKSSAEVAADIQYAIIGCKFDPEFLCIDEDGDHITPIEFAILHGYKTIYSFALSPDLATLYLQVSR